ncbi:MAG: macro domain-containing protein [Nanoarchaeota archaeon]|nr:macro domain-containing protein [Nanoarchaeota archaeon]
MIKLTHGNILKDNSQSLVNPVNCVGIMGAGLALQFKKQYPNNFKEYKLACNLNKVQLGKMFITRLEDEPHLLK